MLGWDHPYLASMAAMRARDSHPPATRMLRTLQVQP